MHGTEGGGGGRGGWSEMEGAWQWSVEGMMVEGGGDGGTEVQRRRRRLEDSGITITAEKNRGRGKEWRRSSRRRRWLDSFPGLPLATT